MNVNLTISMTPEQLVESFLDQRQSQKVMLDFLCAVDLGMADAGFTEELVRRLAVSLRKDYEDHEWEAFITTLVEPAK